MVITDEYKFPRRPRIDTGESLLKIRESDGLEPVIPINQFTRKWRRENNRPYLTEVDESLPDGAEKTLQLLIRQVNDNLEQANIAIHIGLVKEAEGYALDIYDCTSGRVCRLIKDKEIHITELPELLKNLQQEAGLLIDLKA